MLAGQTGKGITENPLDVGDELAIASGDAVEEGEETWTIAPGPDGGDFRDVVFGNVRPRPPGREIYDAIRRVQLPGISVPLVYCRGDAPISEGEALDRRNSLRAGQARSDLGFVAFGRGL